MTPNQKAEGLSTSSERVSETAEIEHEPIGPFDRTSSAHYTEGQADADGLKPQVRDHSETLSAFTVMRDEFFPDAKPQPLAKADEVEEAVERLTHILGLVDDGLALWTHGGPQSTVVTYADLRTILADHARLTNGLRGIDDDYMTSEAHHPNHVLIPTAKFEALRTLTQGDNHER